MTIDETSFEMTLEVLGGPEEAREFFQSYERETVKDISVMQRYLDQEDWVNLKRSCHTWKGRNAQIGFKKSSHLAASLHDFLQITFFTVPAGQAEMGEVERMMVKRQVGLIFESLQNECQVIIEYLKNLSLLK